MLQSRCKKKYNWLTETADGRKHEEAVVISMGQVHKHLSAFSKRCDKTPLRKSLKDSKWVLYVQVPQVGEKYKSRRLLQIY